MPRSFPSLVPLNRSGRCAVLLAAAVAATTVAAQPVPRPAAAEVPVTEEAPGLMQRARVGTDSARAIARTRVPGGRITKAELERERGRLLYSFDLAVPGRRGIEEVHVDARTGAVLRVTHEDDALQAAPGGRAQTSPAARRP